VTETDKEKNKNKNCFVLKQLLFGGPSVTRRERCEENQIPKQKKKKG
jgi:hypothetical protein